jgi:pimeloyl-ACP methyl ester carboxylesterase
MKGVDAAKVSTRSEADKLLERVEPEVPVRQFLLTNMVSENQDGKSSLRFRLPLELLSEEVPLIGDFPFNPPPPVAADSPQWTGPTVFLKGSRSKYINKRNVPVIEAFFPNADIVTLEAGHWVQSEQPQETVEIVAKLIQGAK